MSQHFKPGRERTDGAHDPPQTTLTRPLGDPLAELVAARLRILGQPLRVRLIDHLDHRGESRVQALADDLEMSQQNASKHLIALWRAGVLTRRHEGRVTIYQLADSEALVTIERTALTIANQLLRRPWTSHDTAP